MIATREDYDNFLAALTPEEAALLADAGIHGPPDDARILAANCFDIREEDGLPKYLRNGSARVPDPLTASHEAEEIDEPTDPLREDLAEGLRKVFLWLLAGLTARQILKRPQVVANRAVVIGRVLGLNNLGECTLADLAKHSGMSKACFSKLGVGFRDFMGNRFLAARGDREHTREGAKRAASRAWQKRKKTPRP